MPTDVNEKSTKARVGDSEAIAKKSTKTTLSSEIYSELTQCFWSEMDSENGEISKMWDDIDLLFCVFFRIIEAFLS